MLLVVSRWIVWWSEPASKMGSFHHPVIQNVCNVCFSLFWIAFLSLNQNASTFVFVAVRFGYVRFTL